MSAVSYSWLLPGKQQLSRWLTVLSAYAGVQLVVQILTFLCGISIVRTLSKQDYAVYTIAGSALGLLSSLSDLGIGNALLALGGRVWQSQLELGRLIRTALSLRLTLFGFGALIASVYFFVLAQRAHTALTATVVIWALLLFNALLQLNYTLWSVAPRLHSQIKRLQRLDLGAAALRLALLLASLRFLTAPIAIAINGMGFVLQAFMSKRWSRSLIEPSATAWSGTRREITKLAANQAPNALFYCFYSQSAVMAISLFGRVKQIAEVGALSRLAVLFTILASVMTNIVLPGFARVRTRRAVAGRYVQVIVAYLTGAATLLLGAVLFPGQLTWVLGSRYRGLDQDVKWIVGASLISTFVGLIWSLNASRGWVAGAWLTIPLMVLVMIVSGRFILNLSTIRGAIMIGPLAELSALLVLLPLALRGLKSIPSHAQT